MAESSISTAINLEKELTCAICTEILYQPLTLLDCLHTFCGSCLKLWFPVQAASARDSRSNPYTCPSCRKSVRATSNDAKINTLLEMYLLANPQKGRTEEEKKELASKYTKGENVIPKRSERRREEPSESDRRMVEEARELSLRDMNSRDGRAGYERGVRHRQRSRERRRGEDRSRSSAESNAQARHIEHQSSLRSLISTDELDSGEMMEEILRQISEDGLLADVDIHNLNPTQLDELTERIAEAYRRRHGTGSASPAVRASSSRRETTSSRTASRARAGSRPRSAGRPTTSASGVSDAAAEPVTVRRHARSTSAADEPRSSHPPVTRPHLLDADAALEPNRSRRSSETRRQTSPSARTTPVVQQAARSATDLSSYARSDSTDARPRIQGSSRRNTDPRHRRQSDVAADRPRMEGTTSSPRTSTLSVASASGPSTSPQRSSRQRPTAIEISRAHVSSAPTTPRSVDVVQSTQSQTRSDSPRGLSSESLSERPRLYPEISISCDSCGKQHIEYDLHEHCSICKDGNYNICHRCYRQDKGCLHWFGFGNLAWYRFQRGASHQDPPHALVGRKYVQPKHGSTQPSVNGTLMTTEEPSKRLLTGAFCSKCHAFADDCLWKCDYCNEGEWGYCNTCVSTGQCCSHPLLPLANGANIKTSTAFTSTHPEATFAPITSPRMIQTYPPTNISSPAQYRPLTFSTSCNICHYPIQPSQSRYHCYKCSGGDYDICNSCYAKLVDSGRISRENSDKGWRRCLKDHRMVKLWFEDSPLGQRRVIVNDLVGGLFLEDDHQNHGEWSWVEGGQRRTKSLSQRMFDESQQSETTASVMLQKFPPDGGVGLHLVAAYPWLPAVESKDELEFPRGAEIREAEEMGDWYQGAYAGQKGLFPKAYATVLGQVTM